MRPPIGRECSSWFSSSSEGSIIGSKRLSKASGWVMTLDVPAVMWLTIVESAAVVSSALMHVAEVTVRLNAIDSRRMVVCLGVFSVVKGTRTV